MHRFTLALLLLAPALRADERPAVLQRDPDESRRVAREAAVLYGMAIFHQKSDRLLEAKAALEEVLRLDPEAVAPRHLLVPLYTALHRPELALSTARRIVELAPDQAAGWLVLAELLSDQRRADAALDALGRAAGGPAALDAERLVRIARRVASRFDSDARPAGSATAFSLAARVVASHRDDFAAEPMLEAELTEAAGQAAVRAGQIADADRAFARAEKLFRDANNTAALKRLTRHHAALLAARNEWPAALEQARIALSDTPGDVAAATLLLDLLRRSDPSRNHAASVRRWINDATEAQKPALLVLLGEEQLRFRPPADAEAAFEEALRSGPNLAAYRGLYRALGQGDGRRLVDAVSSRSRDAQRDGATALAKAHWRAVQQALHGEPRLVGLMISAALRVNSAQGDGPAWRALATLAERAGQLDAAEAMLRQAIHHAGDQQEHEVIAGLLSVMLAAGKYEAVAEEALRSLETAQATSRVMLHNYAAMALSRCGRHDEALAQADKMVATASEEHVAQARFRRVDVLTQARRFAEAEAACRALLPEIGTTGRDARYRLALVFAAARQFGQAERQLRILIASDETYATAYNDLGYHLAEHGKNLDEAERFVRKALELDRMQRLDGKAEDDESPDENAAYLDSLGWVLFRRNRLPEAVELLEKASGLPEGARDPIVWDHLGDVLLALGQREAAGRAWAKAGELYVRDRRIHNDVRAAELNRKRARLAPEK